MQSQFGRRYWSSEGPAYLAQGVAASSRMVRASLMKSDFLMRSLGPAQSGPNRLHASGRTGTTLEALDLSNGQTSTNALDQGAGERLREARVGIERRAGELGLCLYPGAFPDEAERAAAAGPASGRARASCRLADFLWAVLMQPEFQFVR